MKINWKVRFQNIHWVLAMLSVCVTLATAVALLFGFEIDMTAIEAKVAGVVVAAYAVYGTIIDPTTAGVSDSKQALAYETPKDDYQKDD